MISRYESTGLDLLRLPFWAGHEAYLDTQGKPEVSHPEAPRAAAPKAVSPEAAAARKKVDDLIGQAIAAHAWTDRDRMDLRPLEAQLPDPEETVRALVQAMNDGRVAVQTDGPPL